MCVLVYPPHRQMGSDSFFPYAVTDSTACIFSPFLPGITLRGALKNGSLMFWKCCFVCELQELFTVTSQMNLAKGE